MLHSLLACVISLLAVTTTSLGRAAATTENGEVKKLMSELRQANGKMGWNLSIYPDQGWHVHGHSVKGRPLIYFECGEKNNNTTLMLSSVHGDEITPVYFGLRLVSWVRGEPEICDTYHVVVAPLINPDGYLAKKKTRTNSRGVDLNRNFPTKDFSDSAIALWKSKFASDPRRFPGHDGGSEPETQFQQWLIDNFKPSKILTVHSPLNFYDYDGPENGDMKTFAAEYVKSCTELRDAVKDASQDYKFMGYGFFPGSLGNYAGKERGIPTLTLELPTTDAKLAKGYFEKLKRGTRQLVVYKLNGDNDHSRVDANSVDEKNDEGAKNLAPKAAVPDHAGPDLKKRRPEDVNSNKNLD